MGLHARLMSQALRKLAGAISKSNCVAIFINQLRSNIGGYGAAETTTGGRALRFYASVRLDIRRRDAIKIGTEIVGNKTEAKVVKNKVAPPFKTAEFDIMYGKGIFRPGEIIELGIKLEIIKRSGAWISYNDEKIAQGRDNAKMYLAEHHELAAELEGKIREKLAEQSQTVGKSAKEAAEAKAAELDAVIAAAAAEAQEEADAEAEAPAKGRRKSKINIDVDVE
jgi:recombination protein RecA